jgi:hypothetical protein
VRKEIAAMSKAAGRAGEDLATWQAAVTGFYEDHAGHVAQTMRIPLELAGRYVEAGRLELLEKGPEAMSDWPTRRVTELAQIATGGEGWI